MITNHPLLRMAWPNRKDFRQAVRCVHTKRLLHATQRPAHHSRVGWSGKPPLALPDQQPDVSKQVAAVEVSNGSGFEDRNDRQGELEAAMCALRIAVMEMRSHDAE